WIDNGQIRQDREAIDAIKPYLSTFTTIPPSGLDLRHIKTRGGNGEIRFTGIEFLSAERQALQLVASGGSLVRRHLYQAEKRIVAPHFGIEIYTDLGTKISTASTWGTGYDISTLPASEGHVDLEIDFLTLMPGRYYISLWLASIGPVYD